MGGGASPSGGLAQRWAGYACVPAHLFPLRAGGVSGLGEERGTRGSPPLPTLGGALCRKLAVRVRVWLCAAGRRVAPPERSRRSPADGLQLRSRRSRSPAGRVDAQTPPPRPDSLMPGQARGSGVRTSDQVPGRLRGRGPFPDAGSARRGEGAPCPARESPAPGAPAAESRPCGGRARRPSRAGGSSSESSVRGHRGLGEAHTVPKYPLGSE